MKPGNIEEKKQERKRSAVMGVVLFALIQIASGACFIALCFIPDTPGWFPVLFGVLAAICFLLLIPAMILLKARFKEIEGGELDAAGKY